MAGHPLHVNPTLPAGTSNDRGGLIGALAFVEGIGIGSMGAREIRNWIEEYLVRAGRMERPLHLTEPNAGTLLFDALTGPTATASRSQLDRILGRARSRVVRMLQGLLQDPPDESFIEAAKTTGRVQSIEPNGAGMWIAQPRKNDALSDIVLNLFVADILSNRTLYEKNLCVCQTCGRISFRARTMPRTSCREHNEWVHQSG
jgi:hypothetical protein